MKLTYERLDGKLYNVPTVCRLITLSRIFCSTLLIISMNRVYTLPLTFCEISRTSGNAVLINGHLSLASPKVYRIVGMHGIKNTEKWV